MASIDGGGDPLRQAMRPKEGPARPNTSSTEGTQEGQGIEDTFTGAKSSHSPSFASKFPRAIAYVLTFGGFYGISKLAVKKAILPALTLFKKDDPDADRVKNNLLKDPNNRHFTLTTHDGAKIDGMLLGAPNNGKPVLMYFCGNAERWEYNIDYPKQLAKELDVNLLVFNYRGVGQSEGFPLVAQDLVTDGDTCKQYLNHLGVDDSRIKIFARSIGGGVGAEVASRYERIAFVSERSFSKFSKVVKQIVGAKIIGSAVAQLIKLMDYEMRAAKAWKKIPADRKLVIVHKGDQIITYPVSLESKLQKNMVKSDNPPGLKTRLLQKLGIQSHTFKTHREQVNALELKDRARGFKDSQGFVSSQRSLEVIRQEYAEKLDETILDLKDFAIEKFPKDISIAQNNPTGFMQEKVELINQNLMHYYEAMQARKEEIETTSQYQDFIKENTTAMQNKQDEMNALLKRGFELAEQLDANPQDESLQEQFYKVKGELDLAKAQLEEIKKLPLQFFERDSSFVHLKEMYEQSVEDLAKLRNLQRNYIEYQPERAEINWNLYGDAEENPHNILITGPEFQTMVSRMRDVYQLAKPATAA